MRIAIVNDLPIAVEALRRVLMTVDRYELIWVATNGAEAVQKCAAARPDLILMDLLMPVMDGVEATRWIMKTCPCAILLVTSSIQANLSQVFAAMCYGALDVVLIPSFGSQETSQAGAGLLGKIVTIAKLIGQPKQNAELNLSGSKSSIENLQALCRANVKTLREGSLPLKGKESLKGNVFNRRSYVPPLVAIGASAGGPKALATILSQLPEDFGAAVAIAQHIDAQFASGLANWLDGQTPLTVELATVGASPQVGKVLIAGLNDHLVLRSNRTFAYSQYPEDDPYRPSVNALFTSVANHWPAPAIAVLLTGMGSDGAVGLKHLRAAGWHTIAQDRSTCAVYGMPKAAVELGAAVEVLPISAIATTLLKLVPSNQPKFISLFGSKTSAG